MPQNTPELLPVTPNVITWARDRAGYSQDEAAKYFKNIAAWENGDSAPSYAQLELMGEKFKVPVAVFFFPKPPDVEPVKQSFRTITDREFLSMPRTVKSLLRKGQAMQLNLAELNDNKNPASKLITRDLKFSTNASLDTMSKAVREYLGISLEEQTKWDSLEMALEQWREAFAKVGIFVFKDAFHIDGYCGFCLYNDEFPVLYINNSTAKARQIFTLFHELAHLLFHTSGIDVIDDRFIDGLPDEGRAIEIICNQFAGKFLVPDFYFDRLLVNTAHDRNTAALLAHQLKVSREVIYRKMLDRGLISREEYLDAAAAWAAQAKPAGAGGNYYFTQIAYLGQRYIDLAFSRYHQHRFDETRLADYLNIKPKNLPAFEQIYSRG